MPTSAEYLRFLPRLSLPLRYVADGDGCYQRAAGQSALREHQHRALVAAAVASVAAFSDPGRLFAMLMVDGFATFFRILVIGVGILAVLASYRYWNAKTLSR